MADIAHCRVGILWEEEGVGRETEVMWVIDRYFLCLAKEEGEEGEEEEEEEEEAGIMCAK